MMAFMLSSVPLIVAGAIDFSRYSFICQYSISERVIDRSGRSLKVSKIGRVSCEARVTAKESEKCPPRARRQVM